MPTYRLPALGITAGRMNVPLDRRIGPWRRLPLYVARMHPGPGLYGRIGRHAAFICVWKGTR